MSSRIGSVLRAGKNAALRGEPEESRQTASRSAALSKRALYFRRRRWPQQTNRLLLLRRPSYGFQSRCASIRFRHSVDPENIDQSLQHARVLLFCLLVLHFQRLQSLLRLTLALLGLLRLSLRVRRSLLCTRQLLHRLLVPACIRRDHCLLLVLDHKSEQLAHVAVEFRERDGLIAAGKIAQSIRGISNECRRQAGGWIGRRRRKERRVVFDKVRDLRARVWRSVDMRAAERNLESARVDGQAYSQACSLCDEEGAKSSVPYSALTKLFSGRYIQP